METKKKYYRHNKSEKKRVENTSNTQIQGHLGIPLEIKRGTKLQNQKYNLGIAMMEAMIWIFILSLMISASMKIHQSFEQVYLNTVKEFQNEWNKIESK